MVWLGIFGAYKVLITYIFLSKKQLETVLPGATNHTHLKHH
jgi:hypothetical protein